MKILLIGETCHDVHVYGECKRLSPEGPAPVFNPINITETIGMAGNVLANLKSIINHLELPIGKNGWQIDIVSNPGTRIIKTRYVDINSNQLLLRVDQNDECERYDGAMFGLFERPIRYDCVIISDYDKGFLTHDAIEKICAAHSLVFLDTKKPIGGWCEKAAWIKINQAEYRQGTINPILFDKTIVTMGRHGAKLKSAIYPVKEVDIKDLSGAGDTFFAALVIKYLLTGHIDDAIVFANECATQVVQKRGVVAAFT